MSCGNSPRSRGRLRGIKKGWSCFMRVCCRQILAIALGALTLGILVFFLLFTGTLTLVPAAAGGIVFFTLVSLLSGGGLLVLLRSVLDAERSPALADA